MSVTVTIAPVSPVTVTITPVQAVAVTVTPLGEGDATQWPQVAPTILPAVAATILG